MIATCPRCKERSEHLYGNTYECPICKVVYEWRLIEKEGRKLIWSAYGKTDETLEMMND